MRAAELAALVQGTLVGPDSELNDLTHDHRFAGAGVGFACIVGQSRDGHDFAADAAASGAPLLLTDRTLPTDTAQVVVDDVRSILGQAASAVHGNPSRELSVSAVTGTNGKTTSVQMLAATMEAAGRTARVIGTLTGVRTTPEATDLQRKLREFVSAGVDSVAMEVSSHALAQGRVHGTTFASAQFTNLGRDHLDYHGDMESYFLAKTRLFSEHDVAHAVICVDDEWGERLARQLEAPITYSIADARELELAGDGVMGSYRFRWRDQRITLGVRGRFNVANAVGVAETARALGVEAETIATALGSFAPVAGRMEPVDQGQPFGVLVDYAHTPDALEAAISAARDLTGDRGRLAVVFGCGGDRDRAKRPEMGHVAEAADLVVVTSDNPRSEDPATIIDEVISGMSRPEAAAVEPDRGAAIRMAIRWAADGDVVLIAGKGHETTQVVGESVIDFDDRKVARAVLAELGSSGW